MFGYVRPPLAALPPEESERFRHIYCGLCHTLGERCGTAARFILNYDFTFLAILLSEGEGEKPEARCPVSPLKKHPYLASNEAMELAADESVILAYWQLRDGVADHDWFHGLKYRSLSAALEPAYRKAAAARPAFDAVTRQQLKVLSELEKSVLALYLEGKCDEAAKLHLKHIGLMNALFYDVNPIPVKEAMNMLGMGIGPCRLPLVPMADGLKQKLREKLVECGFKL